MTGKTAVGFLAAALLCMAAGTARTENCPEPRLITVNGDAEMLVAPDQVVLTLMVETWSKELSDAKSENDRRTKAILDLAKRSGVEEKHIQTDRMSVEPRYNEQWEHKEFIGFFVRKTVAITLNRAAGFEDLLSGALAAGANYVQGIDFRTTELRKHRDQARLMAVKAAREKAEAMSKELGASLGRPHSIQEGQNGWVPVYGEMPAAMGGRMMMQNASAGAGVAAPEGGGSTALGQISITANVTVSFELQ